MLADLGNDDALGILVRWIQQRIEGLRNDRGRNDQQRCTAFRKPCITDRTRHIALLWPIGWQFVDCNTLHLNVVRRLDLEQAVTSWKVLNINLTVNQDLEKRGGRGQGAIDRAAAARVPASRRPQRTISRERQMVADSPEDHLRGHALVDSVQQLFDEAGSRLSRHELERAAAFELPFGGTEPTP